MINIERPWMKSISMMDGNEVMFKLIGLKLYSPNDENAIYHAKMMQKSLYGREDFLIHLLFKGLILRCKVTHFLPNILIS